MFAKLLAGILIVDSTAFLPSQRASSIWTEKGPAHGGALPWYLPRKGRSFVSISGTSTDARTLMVQVYIGHEQIVINNPIISPWHAFQKRSLIAERAPAIKSLASSLSSTMESACESIPVTSSVGGVLLDMDEVLVVRSSSSTASGTELSAFAAFAVAGVSDVRWFSIQRLRVRQFSVG